METGEESAAGRAADWRTCQSVRESHAFAGEPIDVRSEEFGMPHVTRFKIAPFIQHEVNDVGLFGLSR